MSIRSGEARRKFLPLAQCLRVYESYHVKVTKPAKIAAAVLWVGGAFGLAWAVCGVEPLVIIRVIEGVLGVIAIAIAQELIDEDSQIAMRVQNALIQAPGDRLPTLRDEIQEARLDELTKWCKDAFSDFAEYSVYWGEPELNKAKKLRADVQEGVRKFSFGLLEPDPVAYAMPTSFKDGDSKIAWEEACKAEQERVRALSTIWTHAIYPAKLPSSTWCKDTRHIFMLVQKDDNRVEELGERLGIKDMVAAYIEGVPISDITS